MSRNLRDFPTDANFFLVQCRAKVHPTPKQRFS